nr:recQ-mediated genome instability protein 1 [Misgurnus anguillicaudatus]XP_055024195.1 recQ-mediated genome instability protein 1 [Misgurnus anguillicaudatus]
MYTTNEVRVTEDWLRSEWHILVSPAWLDACVNWVKEEANGGAMPQSLLNQRVLEQWLLTDLRDLAHPVLPAGLSDAQKTELNSCYCIQMDSLLDVSQPAYNQLQRIRGTDRSNEEVSAVTQETQRPWEAKPTRMLMLQLTDGVQNLEGMEYRPIPALSANLPPGTKLQLVGPIVVRLGVLLLKAENVKVLGGEVEQLLEMYSQGRMLSGILGLPEENHPQVEEPDDQELLASVEAAVDLQVADSGYDSLTSEASARPSVPRSQSQRRLSPHPQVTPISNEDNWDMVEIPDEDFSSIPDHFDDVPQNVDNNMIEEDFDDIPLEELESVMCPIDSEVLPSTREHTHEVDQHTFIAPNLPSLKSAGLSNTKISSDISIHQKMSKHEIPGADKSKPVAGSSTNRTESSICERKDTRISDTPVPRYLCTIQAGSWPPTNVQVLRLQAFIVTLVGNLSKTGGVWKLGATISDGTGYLDVDLCDEMLANLIGFSATEARLLMKDPARRSEVTSGIQHCQRELVDMCCMMSVKVDQTGRGVVLRADPLTEKECFELQRKVKDKRN